MSLFLVYFETNNSQKGWENFSHKEKEEKIKDTFSIVNQQKDMLTIESISIFFENKHLDGYVIHDGISSDKIIEKKINTPVILTQRKIICDFIERRRTFPKIIYLYFHLFNDSVEKLFISSNVEKEILVNKITETISFLKKEILYVIL